MTKFYFAYDLLICINAETQAQAQVKLLARFDLLDMDDIDDFDVSFRAPEVSDRYFRVRADDSIEWLTVTQVILTERKLQGWRLIDFDNMGPSDDCPHTISRAARKGNEHEQS